MKLVKQPTATTCGAACYAMIKGMAIEEAISIVGNGWTSIDKMLRILRRTEGPDVSFTEIYDGEPLNNIIALQYHQQPDGSGGHWTVLNNGKTLDPACINKLWPILGYIFIGVNND